MKEVLKYLAVGLVGALWIHCSDILKAHGEHEGLVGTLGGAAVGAALASLVSMFILGRKERKGQA